MFDKKYAWSESWTSELLDNWTFDNWTSKQPNFWQLNSKQSNFWQLNFCLADLLNNFFEQLNF